MPIFSHLANLFRSRRVTREIDEELASHVAEAVDRGRTPSAVRRAFGSNLRHREDSRAFRVLPRLDSLRADLIFGARQLLKRKVASAAAILSLALAIGSCASAFRLIDAILLRPLPVAHASHLYYLNRSGIGFDGRPTTFDGWAYPSFQTMRATVKGQADLIAVSYGERREVTYATDSQPEKAFVNFVSGWMFDDFGLRPTIGRLLHASDDAKPGADPYAVISYDYWQRRFASDPRVVGSAFRFDGRSYEIVGVGPENFTGTETGSVTDIFIPAMMNPAAVRNDNTWHRTLVIVNPGVPMESLRSQLEATSRAWERERAKGFRGMTKAAIDRFIDQRIELDPAAAGTSGLQQDYRRSLIALAILVALVLLIACVNVANLMTIQAAARAREMALRVSIGAGRGRLAQLVLIEGALLAVLASICGALFAWWSAPFVVARINPPDNPARLSLPLDWRVVLFGLVLTFAVTLVFALAPALRASAVKPASILKGGSDPHARRRLLHALVAAQVAFCFLVLFVSCLFAATFQRLSQRDMGIHPERLVSFMAVPSQRQLPVVWDQIAAHLRTVPGVERAAIASWALLSPNNATNSFISVNDAPPGPVLAYFLRVSPGWLDTVQLPLIAGRDFRPTEVTPGAAIINETFVKQFFRGENPIGRTFKRGVNAYQVVGIVRDAPYRSLREPIFPVAYTPFPQMNADGTLFADGNAAFVVRTASADPSAMVSTIEREISAARSDFHVSEFRTQQSLIDNQTIRERLFAMLGMFFAAVALLLAGVGLYGVLDYSVLQRRREIGIRVAIGAQSSDIVRGVTTEVLYMISAGAVCGVAIGVLSARYLESMLYQVEPASAPMLVIPAITIATVAAIASIPAVIRALRINPAQMLRSD
ncbi:MAG TPA: ABC transporter permease [Bryobacteraceae bacterium]|nr:ABC transporter permease [Bryobacteraceae bacterium]